MVIIILCIINILLILFLLFKPNNIVLEQKKINEKLDNFMMKNNNDFLNILNEQKILFEKMNNENQSNFNNFILKNTNDLNSFKETLNETMNINSQKIEKSFFDFSKELNETMNVNSKNQLLSTNEFQTNFMKSLNEDFLKLNKNVEDRLLDVSNIVNSRLDKNFEKSNDTFKNIIERLSKIDEAQKKIDNLSTNIVSLQDILNDKKSRGTFGEVQLNNIFESIFGENSELYETQYTLSNKTKVDLILKTPEPLGSICIDSKFPLENYQRMMSNVSDHEKKAYKTAFENDLKKHITDIASKYIIEGETSNQAVMFIPSESIFAQIHAEHQKIIEFGQKYKIWLASPTTLFAQLTTIQVVLRDIERSKYANEIHEHLKRLGDEFDRYNERWAKLEKDIDSVSKDVKNVGTTSSKISKRFAQISKVENLKIED